VKLLASVLLLAVLSLGVVIEGTVSQTVEIMLSGGRTFKGEVISVRDSTVVLGTRPGLSPVEMLSEPGALMVARFSQVLTISTERNTHPVTGMLIGAPVGCLGGLAIGSSIEVDRQPNDTFGCNAQAEHDANKVTGTIVGTAVGMLAGCVIGGATGEKAQVLVSPQQRDFTFLREVSRYPNGEPESLKKIGR
jgi:hypothetical protein